MHLTTTDISLELLLGPQLSAFVDAGYEVIGVSAPGPFVPADRGTRASATSRSATPPGRWRRTRTCSPSASSTRLFRRPAPRHRAHPQPQDRGCTAGSRPGRRGCRSWSTRSTACTPCPRTPGTKRAVVYGLERLAVDLLGRRAGPEPRGPRHAARRCCANPPRKLTLLGNGIDLARFGRRPRPTTERAGQGPGRAGRRRPTPSWSAPSAGWCWRRATSSCSRPGSRCGNAIPARCWSWSGRPTTTRPMRCPPT